MSEKYKIKKFPKKNNDLSYLSGNSERKKIRQKKILNPNKAEKEESFICEFSNELMNEHIKKPEKFAPIINPVPCFIVKNDNSKNIITKKGTFYNNLNTHMEFFTNENSIDYNNDKSKENKEKSKLLDINLENSHINNKKYFRPYSPNLNTKNNQFIKSKNFELTFNTYDKIKINNDIFLNNKNKSIKNLMNNREFNSNPLLSSNKQTLKNPVYYSIDNLIGSQYLKKNNQRIKNNEEERRKRKMRLIKVYGQKINVLTMKIEILENHKKNKNLSSIQNEIEFKKISFKNDLQRIKEEQNDMTNKYLNQIKFLKMKLSNCEQRFVPYKKHKETISQKELEFKIQKVCLIEQIILIKKKLKDSMSPYSTTNETYNYNLDDSVEDLTINDVSLNDCSCLKDNIGINYNFNIKSNMLCKDESFYENKIIRINPKEINKFTNKILRNITSKKFINKNNDLE